MSSIFFALAIVASTGVEVDIRTPKANVLPGEPVKLVLRWQGPPNADVKLENDDEGLRRFLQVWVDDGSGFRRYCEAPRNPVEGVTVRTLPSKPRPYMQNIALVGGEYKPDCSGPARKAFVFPRPGLYRVRVNYAASGDVATLSSNVLAFEVRPPKQEEEVIFETVRQSPWLLLNGGKGGERSLMDQHPDSPYFAFAKARAFFDWEAALGNHEDPDTGQSLWHLSADQYERFAKDQYQRKAEELMADREWGAFDEERLGHALSAAERGGDANAIARIRSEAQGRFGDSQLMQQVLEEEAEDEGDDGELPAMMASPTPQD